MACGFAIRAGWFNWGAPIGLAPGFAGAKTATGTTVTLTPPSALRAGVAAAQFQVLVNGVPRAVNSAVSGATLVLTLASGVTAGQSVVVSYTAGTPTAARLARASDSALYQSGTLAAITAT